MIDLNLNRLHYFYICAQNKNVTQAAKILGITQPSLSQQLKIFESEVGEPLFVRNGRALDLSPVGRTLYEKSKSLFEIAESLSRSLNGQDLALGVSFRIGVSDEIDRPFVAEIVGKLLRNKMSEKIKFDVISETHREITDHFSNERFDLVITNIAIPRKTPAYVFDFPVYLVTSKKQKDFKRINEVNLSSVFHVLNEDLIIPGKGMVLRHEVDQMLKKLPSRPTICFESNIMACTVRAICEGIGCGFLPLPYIRHDYQHGLLSTIGPTKGYWRHRVYFYSKRQTKEIVVRNLAQVVKEFND